MTTTKCTIQREVRKKYKSSEGIGELDISYNPPIYLSKDIIQVYLHQTDPIDIYLVFMGLYNKSMSGVCILHNVICDIPTESEYMLLSLSNYGRTVINLPNAGGNSVVSEVLSIEIILALINTYIPTHINYWFGKIITENEVIYTFRNNSPQTDYVIQICDRYIAVSVSRAMQYNTKNIFNNLKARALIEGKIRRICESNENVIGPIEWSIQILHILVQKHEYVIILQEEFDNLPQQLTQGICMILSLCEWSAPFMKDELFKKGEINNNVVIGGLSTIFS